MEAESGRPQRRRGPLGPLAEQGLPCDQIFDLRSGAERPAVESLIYALHYNLTEATTRFHLALITDHK